ncbi:DUF4184 family protein [Kineosporia sp. J2-2]|uniref:DUF4184 family protein n=1 Tax=Kineosporia corallincola TaxID=2835133 RepID=A0ABS5TH03_9ACTN|nr:DUF4184 family protein [Kineosporia corallincola]MBT0770371.1 DUF4184 family protein [Kineosporia corallincola]
MPFTGSHPAAVLPLMRTPLVPSALVIGSMTPDLVYYLPLGGELRGSLSHTTHTAPGVIGLDLVLGLVAFALWQALIAPFAVAVAPAALRDRLGPDLPRPAREHLTGPKAVVLVVVSQWVGTVTHVVWDEFTHPGRWGTAHIAWLAQWHGPLEGYHWAQYGSGVVGLLLIGLALGNWWRRTGPEPGGQRVPALRPMVSLRIWAVVLACAGVGAALGARTGLGGQDPHSMGYLVATYGGGAGMFAALACALAVVPGLRSAR